MTRLEKETKARQARAKAKRIHKRSWSRHLMKHLEKRYSNTADTFAHALQCQKKWFFPNENQNNTCVPSSFSNLRTIDETISDGLTYWRDDQLHYREDPNSKTLPPFDPDNPLPKPEEP